MNVFELASQYRHLEALVDQERDDIDEAALVQAWLETEGDLNAKMENLGFAIRNREAILAGKQDAIKAMEATAISVEKEIERLKTLAINLLTATNHKQAGGNALKLSVVPTPPKVEIEDAAKLPAEYLREIPAVAASTAPDKKKLADDMKQGVIVAGAKLVPGVRLAIK
jgi:hypothetical protein